MDTPHPNFLLFARMLERSNHPAPVRAHFVWLAWSRYCSRSIGAEACSALTSMRLDAIFTRARPVAGAPNDAELVAA